ncbi:MAG: UDP-galactopyranose mutase [Candidatus Methanomethylophilaceae archaeon]|nr:UDP-galactopyranose mutase [Candidatus Methanomethylophilaceae archaeon]
MIIEQYLFKSYIEKTVRSGHRPEVTSVKVLVVGAGISGATVANLASRTARVEVIDSRGTVGGNCYDYRDVNGIMVHRYGSHILHTSDGEVWGFLSRFASFNTYMHRVMAMVEGMEVPIPFNFNSIRKVFPETLAERIESKLLSSGRYGDRIPIMEFLSQDDEDLRFLAEYIYEHIFRHYTEKQWGTEPSNVDGAVTARVPVRLSCDDRYFQDRYQGIPVNGYTDMIRRMLSAPGIELRLNTPFSSVGDVGRYDHIFYTGPVDELMGYRFGPLPYRSLRFEFEEYDMEHYQDNAVVNYPDNYDFTRIHEFKYYLRDRSERTVICKEYPEEFAPGSNERYYPVPSETSGELYAKYRRAAEDEYPNLRLLGRLGDYRYYDMDEAVARAMEVWRSASAGDRKPQAGMMWS